MKNFFSQTQLVVLNRELDKLYAQIKSCNNYVEKNIELINNNVDNHKEETTDQLSALNQQIKRLKRCVIILAITSTIATGYIIYAIN